MARSTLLLLLIAVLGLASASAQRRGRGRLERPDRPVSSNQLNPEGQPRNFKAGETHRYFVWHDREGWHLRTTTARQRHRFHGEVIAIEGLITELRPLPGERFDKVKLSPDKV